jgi:hypothetical protein
MRSICVKVDVSQGYPEAFPVELVRDRGSSSLFIQLISLRVR